MDDIVKAMQALGRLSLLVSVKCAAGFRLSFRPLPHSPPRVGKRGESFISVDKAG